MPAPLYFPAVSEPTPQPPARRRRSDETPRPLLGWACVVGAVLASPWVLGALFSGDGSIDSPWSRGLILLFDGVLLLVGLYLAAGGRPSRLPGLLAFAAVNVLVFGELGLRLAGMGPWEPPELGVTVEPGGRFFEADDELGFRMLPGEFAVTLATGYRFEVTHDERGLRPTRPAEATPPTDAPALWTLGCSFTHGWTIDDHETWPWLLAAAHPEREVLNLGVDGYGTLQSKLLLERMLAQADAPPAVVVLAYASFHDVRNTFVRLRRKDAAPANQLGPLTQPYARLEPDGQLTVAMAEVVYEEWPLMRSSAVVHALEQAWNDLEESRAASPVVSWLLILDLARICEETGVTFVVAGMIDDGFTAAMGDRCREVGIPFVDASVDLTDPAMTNLPHDAHPSAAAAARYAEAIDGFLEAEGLLP
jgi:hypothetical protein